MVIYKPRLEACNNFFPHRALRENQLYLSIPQFQTSSLQICEITHFYCISYSVCETLLQQPQQMNTLYSHLTKGTIKLVGKQNSQAFDVSIYESLSEDKARMALHLSLPLSYHRQKLLRQIHFLVHAHQGKIWTHEKALQIFVSMGSSVLINYPCGPPLMQSSHTTDHSEYIILKLIKSLYSPVFILSALCC